MLTGEATGRNSSYVVLANNGDLTPAGVFYYDTSGLPRPNKKTGDLNQALVHRNGSDYITVNGKQKLVRTLQPTGKTVLTALGRQFFNTKNSEYVVHVPTVITGTRSNGQSYQRVSTLPVDQLGLGMIMASQALTPTERVAEVKKKVLAGLVNGGVSSGGRQTLMEISGETIQLDRDGTWLISVLTTSVDAAGVVSTEARIKERLGCLRNAASFLPYHEHILPEAFETHNDKLCVPRQLAVLLSKSQGDLRVLRRSARERPMAS